jgi:hypothetical protein
MVVVVFIVVAGAFLFLGSGEFNSSPRKTITTIASSTVLAPLAISSQVVNGTVSVSAGNYTYYQVSIPASASNVTFSGSFTTSGGGGNDIEVLIMDQSNFASWQHGGLPAATASKHYDSGQTTAGSFSLGCLPGTYFVVYSDTFSSASSKTVNTMVSVMYNLNAGTVVTYTTTYITS